MRTGAGRTCTSGGRGERDLQRSITCDAAIEASAAGLQRRAVATRPEMTVTPSARVFAPGNDGFSPSAPRRRVIVIRSRGGQLGAAVCARRTVSFEPGLLSIASVLADDAILRSLRPVRHRPGTLGAAMRDHAASRGNEAAARSGGGCQRLGRRVDVASPVCCSRRVGTEVLEALLDFAPAKMSEYAGHPRCQSQLTGRPHQRGSISGRSGSVNQRRRISDPPRRRAASV